MANNMKEIEKIASEYGFKVFVETEIILIHTPYEENHKEELNSIIELINHDEELIKGREIIIM